MDTIGSLPKHKYVWVDSAFIRKGGSGFEPAVWFGLVSIPGRAWGLNLMIECGAVYRNVPPHAVAFSNRPGPWAIEQAQMWDCYGERFAVHEYTYLSGLSAICRVRGADIQGDYLFTVCPVGDGFSAAPEQAKEFMFFALDNDRLTILPTNRVIFVDKSFTINAWPTDIVTNTTIHSCEES